VDAELVDDVRAAGGVAGEHDAAVQLPVGGEELLDRSLLRRLGHPGHGVIEAGEVLVGPVQRCPARGGRFDAETDAEDLGDVVGGGLHHAEALVSGESDQPRLFQAQQSVAYRGPRDAELFAELVDTVPGSRRHVAGDDGVPHVVHHLVGERGCLFHPCNGTCFRAFGV